MSSLSDIYKGWKAYVVSDPVALEVAKKRAEVCLSCVDDDGQPTAVKGKYEVFLPDFKLKEVQGLVCSKERGGCGCPLSTATRSESYKCIKGKW
jgi:hypothetical protein